MKCVKTNCYSAFNTPTNYIEYLKYKSLKFNKARIILATKILTYKFCIKIFYRDVLLFGNDLRSLDN